MSVVRGRGRPGPRRALSESDILDAALQLMDDGGSAAASIRKIAARVGVAPNAVYTYFPDKAAVEHALVERLLGEIDEGVFADRSRPWRERVEAGALETRARLTDHPGVVPLAVGRPMDGPHALALNEHLLGILADAGLDPLDAARAAYLLIIYVFGAAALEVANSTGTGALPSESERTDARLRTMRGIPAEHFPHTAAASPVRARYTSTEQYLWGLRRLLDALDPGAGKATHT